MIGGLAVAHVEAKDLPHGDPSAAEETGNNVACIDYAFISSCKHTRAHASQTRCEPLWMMVGCKM